MSLIPNRLGKSLFSLLLITVIFSAKAQTTLVAGDIAFTGYHGTPNAPQNDAFSFVLLTGVTANTVINFTENAWGNNNAFRTGENTVTLTFVAAQNAGTEITIAGQPSGVATATLALGGSAGTCTGTMLSLSVNGDQVIAYQGTAVSPTFISAIHMNVYNGGADPSVTDATNWDNLAAASQTSNSSFIPTGLTTGTNCIWIGTQGNISSERNNARFNCALATSGGANLSTAAGVRAACNNQAFWDAEFAASGAVPTWLLPSGCAFISAPPAPNFTLQPSNAIICFGANASFTVTATGALTYQWQVDNGGGFANITNDAIYGGASTNTLNLTAPPISFNGYIYRCVATNAGGPTNSNNATLTVNALPVSPTLLAKTPNAVTVADGTPVSATFNAGSGGTGCSDDYRYTTNGGASYLPYTPGSNISTTGLAAGTGVVTIEGRRANCSAGCQGNYVALASWIVTPLPAGATTLNAGDIAFTSYAAITDEFSFVLLRNIGPGTAVNFTNNGWLSTNVFRTGEESVTWTSNAAYSAGTEIKISGLTATLQSSGSAGTVTGTALGLNINGDQVLAYRGAAATPTFISAIHMNVYSIAGGDAVTTTAAAWDGTANSVNASALPTGLTTGVNAIWIGTQDVPASEFDNSRYGNCAGPGTLGPIATLRSTLNNKANWISNNNSPTPGFAIPTGCNYLGVGALPNISGQPANTAVCEGSNASFSITVTGGSTYQWQVDPGTGFVNVTDNAIYSGSTTTTLNITAAPFSINNTQYRCIVTNGSGSVTSNGASLTLTPLAVAPTLLAKTPASGTVADGTPVSATFNPGSGGATCTDDFRYTTDGGVTYLPYTPGSNISTTGLAAGSGVVFIEGRRAGCSGILACDVAYRVLASWHVTPLPAAPTTLNAGDIAFSGYTSTTANSDFSFVLLKNVGSGTTINFTDNGWLSTNVFRTGENTVTWTAPAGGLKAGNEIKISGLTASLSGGGVAGTVTGTGLGLSQIGDQILAYRGTAASPTFISAIHMNVYSTTNFDPVTTTTAAWDGTANTTSSSALPTGLTTGVNAIWIGTQDVISSEHFNAKYGICNLPAVAGSIVALRTALNNQANWTVDDNTPPAFSLPTGCNYISVLAPTINVTGTPLAAFTSCAGTASAEQNFVVSGSALTANIIITPPTGFEISTTSGSGFASTLTLTQSGGSVPNTTIYVRMAASATGTPSGNITVASSGAITVNVAVSGTVNPIPPTPTITPGGPTTFCAGGSVTLTSSSATGNLWSTGETTQSIVVSTSGTVTVTVTAAGCTSAASPGVTVTVNPLPATPTITPGGPTTFCTGGSVVLTSSSATGNLWSTGETTQSITVSTAGTYTVTVTAAGCTSAPSAGTTVTVDALPTTANAGPDINACVNPGTTNMAANTPAVGTGAWTQIGGPVTTSFGINNPITLVVGLNTPGTYTYVWTISNGTCAPSRDTMTITVNANPATFTLTGGGTFCPGTTTLTGPSVPNSTYTWQRSLSGIANPNSYTNFGGTTSTQDVTSSGNYRLVITNQFGCSTSDSTPVSMADFVFNGSLATGDAQQTGRLNRFAVLSTCAAPKTCPLTFTTTGARFYDSYNITNPRSVPVCATIGLRSDCGTSLFNVAYLGSFNPTALCTNYLADPGSSFPGTGYMEVTIPANATIVVVVHEVNPATGCASYQLTVDVPRESGITVNPSTPICSGTPVTLTAPLANSYSWNPGGNTTPAITVSPTATSKYFVTTGYGNVGCTTLDSATVVVQSLPTVAFAGNDTAVCGLTINNLAANTPVVGTGTWTLVTGPGTVNFTNANAPNSGATASVNGVYTIRWTIATGGACPNSSQDDVQVNFAATPSTADAGLDKTACVSPARATMTAAVPTAGTGVWTQVAGPVTANIISPNAPNTVITGLNTIGTYTFRWTVSNNPCPSNFDEVDVVVNGNPASFSITGGGTFCPTGTTLAGPVDPNYTYQWGKSYLTAPFTGVGTAQTLAVTSSGIYELVVTNQFGCSTSNTTVVNAADYVFNGSLAAGDATQTGRLNRFAAISTCAAPKACPNTFTTTGSRVYDSYTITNPRPVPVCAVIGLNSGCGTAIFSVAYSNSFDPNNLCNNYLADPGSSPSTSIFYEATIPANGTIVVVVHEVNPGQGCANYSLTVDVPRDGAPIVVNPPSVTCASTATLTAPVANSYLWAPGGATTRSFTTPPLFVDTKYKVTLGYGNNGCTRLDSATVTVTSLPPTITCPANITANNTPGICGRAVTYTPTVGGLPAPTVTYAFTGATIASGSGDGSGSVFNVGVTTVTLTASNACGSVNCSFTITINDNQAPTVTVGTIGSCYPTVAAAQAAALAATSATDNCPGVLTETASTVGTCSAVVTVRTTDVAGNFTDVTYNTRIDNTAPTVTVGTIGSCYPTVAAAQAAALAATSATDNCPGALIEVASTVGTCSAVITVTTTDGCGNATAVTYNTRIDNTAPTVTVGTIGSCYPTVAAAEAAALAATSATDNCPGALTEVASTVGTCSAVVTVTTTDGCGNATAVTYNTRIDNTAPIVTVGTIGSCYPTVAAAEAAALAATSATDNCPGALTEVASTVGTCSAVVTVTTTDGCGNATAVTYNTRIDNSAPTLTCPGPITVCGPAAVPVADITSVTNVTDNCPGAIIVSHMGDVVNGFSLTVPYTITRTYRATDGCGNFTECTQTITVNPVPNAVATPSAQTICSGSAITNIVLTGNVPGTVFNWSRDNNVDVIGIASSGSGAAFIGGNLTNLTNAPVTVTFTVTPSFTNAGVTCTGPSVTATVVVNPIPNAVATPASQTVCSGSAITSIALTGNVTGTVYNWTRDNTVSVTGIGANGTGNISGTLTNTTNAPVTVTFTITPSYTNAGATCTGSPITATVVVNPIPNAVATPASQTICSGSNISNIILSGNVANTDFNWTRNNTATVTGIASSGSGDISGSLVNTTNAPITVTFTITPSYTNGGVTCTGTPVTATVVVNPIPNAVATPSAQTICSGSAITAVALTGNVSGTVYSWTRDNTGTVTGIAASGTGNISGSLTNSTTSPITVTFTITPSFTNAGATCTGAPITATVVVNPIPNAIANPAAQTICSGSTIAPINSSGDVIGTVFNWTRNNTATVTGIAASGTGTISGSLTNTTTAPITVTFTITPSYTNAGVTCTGTPTTATVVVNPIPNVVAAPVTQTICTGSAITAIAMSGNVTGTVYNWTRNNTGNVSGIANNGTGNITGTLTSSTNVPETVVFTITPSYTNAGVTCTGPTTTATVIVNPIPTVNAVASQAVCNNSPTAAVSFSGTVTGTVYNWTNNNTAIGLGASGTGTIPSFTAVNTGVAPVVATITVTPTYTNAGTTCTGTPITFTITVNPTPTVNVVANQARCHNTPTAAVSFTGAVTGTVFNWTNNNTSIGLASSGTGNIPSFIANNTGNNPVVATITVTPVYTNNGISCSGTPITFTITVNPLPNIVFTGVPARVCTSDTIVRLRALPAGGTWSGRGVTGDNFNAVTAGLGVTTISYTVTDANGCTATEFRNITVMDCQERHNRLAGAVWLFPNPNTGRFNLRFNTDLYKEANVRITTVLGQVIKEFKFSNLFFGSVIPFDLRGVPNGTYILQIYNGSDFATLRFIKK